MKKNELSMNLHYEEIARIIALDSSLPHLFKVPLITLCHVEQTKFIQNNPAKISDAQIFVTSHTNKRVEAFKRFLNTYQFQPVSSGMF